MYQITFHSRLSTYDTLNASTERKLPSSFFTNKKDYMKDAFNIHYIHDNSL